MLRLLAEMPNSLLLLEQRDTRLDTLLESVPPERIVGSIEEVEGAIDLIVLDRFSMSRARVRRFLEHGTTIGVDLGGEGRALCDYLVDLLPRLDTHRPNVAAPELLVDPSVRALPAASGKKFAKPTGASGGAGLILVTFGGEDPARLTEPTAAMLATLGYATQTLVVRPALRETGELPENVEAVGPQPSLVPLLQEASVVITSFGVTAYEARTCGARVVTIAPTVYHDRLARQAGFARAGVIRPNLRRLRNTLELAAAPQSEPRAPAGSGAARGTLGLLLESLAVPRRRGCPAHPGARGPAVARYEEKSYFRCPVCDVVYLERFTEDEETYGKSYFMEEYRAQYGRTYLEDFAHIREMGRERINRIVRVRNRAGLSHSGGRPTLLDIGCAYGPFLAAADDAGFEPFGIDVARDAVEHVRSSLGFRACLGDVLSCDLKAELGRTEFDVVTLWYVIEHFDRLDELLRLLAACVRPGGVLALSTPHGAGVSARRRPLKFYAESPRDHYTIWTRSSGRNILAAHGFAVHGVRITGHHPERYPFVARGLMPTAFARLHSRLAGCGDTFELYAVKER